MGKDRVIRNELEHEFILDIFEDDGMVRFGAGLEIAALMHFPDDQNARENYHCQFAADWLLKTAEEDGVTANRVWMPYLYNLLVGPSLKQREALAKKRQEKGRTVGLIFIRVNQMAEKIGKRASLNMAVESLEPELSLARSTMLNYWTVYKPVAHLWASYLIVERMIRVEESNDEVLTNRFQTFLLSAERFRYWAAGFKPKSAGAPLVAISEAWALPDEYEVTRDEDLRFDFPHQS